ncbi:MAG: hypothetical protein ACRDTD_14285 [Pseudonocardiaceae bacterium]
MPNTRLDTSAAVELAELLTLLTDWLAADPDHLNASLTRYIGHPAYGLDQLRTDLHRFVFLLGGDDGKALFGDHT